MPESVSGLAYGVGFVCATALLHAVGIGLATATGHASKEYNHRIVQASGGAMAIAGMAILAGVL